MIPFWITVAFVAALDQWSKDIVASSFLPGESRLFIPHIVYWTYVQNHSGAFGLFGTQTWLLVAMAVGVLLAFWYSFRDIASHELLVRLAFGGIVGGAVGNIIDRFHHAYVVDFIDFRWWPVFNAADSFISIGVVVLIITSLRRGGANARPNPVSSAD
jgi:signal peptidase II